ncbi:MAG: FHA domain-containing protein [Anaerolineales bacterium]
MAADYRLQWYFNDQIYDMGLALNRAVVIGREDQCDVVVADERVSRRQALLTLMIEAGEPKIELRNLSRSNKIYFRQPDHLDPLPQGGRLLLTPGMVFQMSTAQFRVIEAGVGEPVVVCWNCERKVDIKLQDCPWCGVHLAFGKVQA